MFESLHALNRSWLSFPFLSVAYGAWQHGGKNEKESGTREMPAHEVEGTGTGVSVYQQPDWSPWAC